MKKAWDGEIIGENMSSMKVSCSFNPPASNPQSPISTGNINQPSNSSTFHPLEIHLDVSDEMFINLERFRRCAICEIIDGSTPSIDEVEEALSAHLKRSYKDWTIRVINSRNFLIQFLSCLEVDLGFTDEPLIMINSTKLKVYGWSPSIGSVQGCKKTGVWIRLRNVPFHAWTPFYFGKIVESFGRLLDIDHDTITRTNLEEARVEVLVASGKSIPEKLKIVLLGESYWVLIIQEKPSVHVSRSRRRARRKPKIGTKRTEQGFGRSKSSLTTMEWQPKESVMSTAPVVPSVTSNDDDDDVIDHGIKNGDEIPNEENQKVIVSLNTDEDGGMVVSSCDKENVVVVGGDDDQQKHEIMDFADSFQELDNSTPENAKESNSVTRELGITVKMLESAEQEILLEKINENIHEYKGDSSSSDSDYEKIPSHAPKKKHLFGRTEPVHTVLGGGKSADMILWRNKQTSASIVSSMTVIWLLFEWIGYHLLPLLCYTLIFVLTVLFLWSNASALLKKTPPKLPEVILPEEVFLNIVQVVRYEINEAFATFRYVATGRDLKQFLVVIAGLWVLSIVGGWFNFLTLFYIVLVLLYTVPVLYEKYEEHVDVAADKALIEINKQYKVLDAKVLQKIPKLPFITKKQQ